MRLSLTEKAKMAEHLRNTNVTSENITPKYRKNLELAERLEMDVPARFGTSKCFIFFAKNRINNCPVHINVHGGGFVRPHMLRDEIYCAKVAGAIEGIVVDVDYRLAPEYPFPTAFEECYDVCKWVFEQANEWNADEARISMGGHSAGGNLTAAVALKANQTGDFRLCLQIINYAALDMVTDPCDKPEAGKSLIPVERCRMFSLAYTDGDEAVAYNPFCSPSAATDEMLVDLPEALVISAGKDNFRFEDETYAVRLITAGVKVTAKRFLHSDHGFIINCVDEWEEAQKLIIEAINQARGAELTK